MLDELEEAGLRLYRHPGKVLRVWGGWLGGRGVRGLLAHAHWALHL